MRSAILPKNLSFRKGIKYKKNNGLALGVRFHNTVN